MTSSRGTSGGGEPAVVEVRRSGGSGGRRAAGRVDLWVGADPRADEVAALVRRVRGRELTGELQDQDQPDRFVYAFLVDGHETVVPEQRLSPDLKRLAAVVLGGDER